MARQEEPERGVDKTPFYGPPPGWLEDLKPAMICVGLWCVGPDEAWVLGAWMLGPCTRLIRQSLGYMGDWRSR